MGMNVEEIYKKLEGLVTTDKINYLEGIAKRENLLCEETRKSVHRVLGELYSQGGVYVEKVVSNFVSAGEIGLVRSLCERLDSEGRYAGRLWLNVGDIEKAAESENSRLININFQYEGRYESVKEGVSLWKKAGKPGKGAELFEKTGFEEDAAKLYYKLGDFESAGRCYTKAFQKHVNRGGSSYDLNTERDDLKLLRKAALAYTKAKNAQSLYELGDIAKASYSKAKEDGHCINHLILTGVALEICGRIEDSKKVYDAAAEDRAKVRDFGIAAILFERSGNSKRLMETYRAGADFFAELAELHFTNNPYYLEANCYFSLASEFYHKAGLEAQSRLYDRATIDSRLIAEKIRFSLTSAGFKADYAAKSCGRLADEYKRIGENELAERWYRIAALNAESVILRLRLERKAAHMARK